MQPHQKRVMEEKDGLDKKLAKLSDFIDSEAFSGIDPAERVRLCRQWDVMKQYSNILGERIANF